MRRTPAGHRRVPGVLRAADGRAGPIRRVHHSYQAYSASCDAAQGDFPARRMIDSVAGVDPARRARLMQVLDIDPEWRMHRVSDGQRRRVQICLGLLHPFQVGALPSACTPLLAYSRSGSEHDVPVMHQIISVSMAHTLCAPPLCRDCISEKCVLLVWL